jgi:single-stranded DNA-binding protein
MPIQQNNVVLTLRLGADAESIEKDGKLIGARLRGAYSTEKGNSGWIGVTIWDVEQQDIDDWTKGSKVVATGTLGFDEWKNKNDEKRTQITLVADKIAES